MSFSYSILQAAENNPQAIAYAASLKLPSKSKVLFLRLNLTQR